MGIITFVIPGELPTMNEIVAESKKHHMRYAKMKKKYTELAKTMAEGLPTVGKADVEFTWYCKNRRKDKDNIIAGQKFVFDGLVEAGVLKNDGWAEVGEIFHLFGVDARNPRVEVRLREV